MQIIRALSKLPVSAAAKLLLATGAAWAVPVVAQDFAPVSLANVAYVVRQADPRDSAEMPAHSGILGIDGKRYPINVSSFRSFIGEAPYTWTKTSAISGTLAFSLGPTPVRLEVTFTSATQGNYRQSTDGGAVKTGDIFFSALPGGTTPPLLNLSTRAALIPNQPTIAGFVVEGARPRRVLVRAIGPSLSLFGVSNSVAEPILSIFRGNGLIAENSGWGGGQTLSAVFTSVGAFALPTGSRDCALVLTLEPGNYSAHVRAATSGEVLTEIYFID